MSGESRGPWESELVRRAREGDHDAFGELVRTHADRSYAIAMRMTGRPADAQDVVQESMIAAWQHLDGFTGGSSFNTWLTRIVINRCHNHRRASRPEAPLDGLGEGHDGLRVGGEWGGGPDDAVVARARLAAVQGAILDLPFDQRAALVLHTVAGCSHAESARTLGISEAAARVRVHRARASLVERLKDWR